MVLIHGGDTVGFYQEYGFEPLDFSANCNPLGAPASVKRAVCLAAEQMDVYPDPLCRRLCADLAEHEDVEPEHILCGNGSADLIDRLVNAGKPRLAVITDPTFSEYERALTTTDCRIKHFPLEEKNRFAVTDGILQWLTPDVDMLFLCNPNNPTGLTIDQDLLHKILDVCAQAGILLVVDECFNGFLDDPDAHTLKGRMNDCPKLLILKAFTKLYGMAGVRLGYCLCADTELLASMRKAGQPWAVSSPAQAAGIAALREKDYVKEARELVRAERTFLSDALRSLTVKVTDSEANYIFFYTDLPELTARMREKGILIRNGSSYQGLSEGYYRVAVRTHEENARMIDAMTACVTEAGVK